MTTTGETDGTPAQGSFRRLFVTSAVLLISAAAVAAFLMLQAFVAALTPEIEQKAGMVGRVVSGQINQALQLGIPFDRLHGMDAFLDRVLADNRDIAFISVVDAKGDVLFNRVNDPAARAESSKAGTSQEGMHRIRVAIGDVAPSPGAVELAISRSVIDGKISAIFFDMAIVLLVAGLFAFELLSFVFQTSIAGPLSRLWNVFRLASGGDFSVRVAASGHREWAAVGTAWNDLVRRLAEAWQQAMADAESVRATLAEGAVGARLTTLVETAKAQFRVADQHRVRAVATAQAVAVRAPVFVFIMAEEFGRSFLPIFIRDLHDPASILPTELAVGIPMTAFMLMVAIVTPFAGVIVARLGVRKMFMLGIAPSAIGYFGAAFATSIWDLIFWRALAGAGYAIVYIVCQGFVAGAASPQKRAQGMALFMGAVFAAGVCGPALGGVIADQIGARLTFLVSTGLCLLSLGLIYSQLREAGDTPPATHKLKRSDFALVVRNPSFVALLLLSAMPAKMLLTGFLFYLAPLLLAKLDNSASEIGRVLMIYAGCTALLTPIAARIADRWGINYWMIPIGGILSGAGLLFVMLGVDTFAVVLAVLLLGLGHSASIAPQLAIIPEIAERESKVLGVTAVLAVFRAIERLGSVLGPILVALVIGVGGEPAAMVALGAFVIATSALYALLARPARRAGVAAP
jgi:predicted MFS family arabinose efflux permease